VHAGGVLIGAYAETTDHPLQGRVVTYAAQETIDTAPKGYQLYKSEFARTVGEKAFKGGDTEIEEQDDYGYEKWSITYQSDSSVNMLANQIGIAGKAVAIASTDGNADSLFFATRSKGVMTEAVADQSILTRFDDVRGFYSDTDGRQRVNDWLSDVTAEGEDGDLCKPYPILEGNPPEFHFRTKEDLGITDEMSDRMYVLPEMPWQTKLRDEEVIADVEADGDSVQSLSFNSDMAMGDDYPFPFNAGVSHTYSSVHKRLFDDSDNAKDTITEEDLTAYFSEYESEATNIYGYKVVGVKNF
jgi:hypothetical protein